MRGADSRRFLQIVLSTYVDLGVIPLDLARRLFRLYDVLLVAAAKLESPVLFTLAPDMLYRRILAEGRVETVDVHLLGLVVSETLSRVRVSMTSMTFWSDSIVSYSIFFDCTSTRILIVFSIFSSSITLSNHVSSIQLFVTGSSMLLVPLKDFPALAKAASICSIPISRSNKPKSSQTRQLTHARSVDKVTYASSQQMRWFSLQARQLDSGQSGRVRRALLWCVSMPRKIPFTDLVLIGFVLDRQRFPGPLSSQSSVLPRSNIRGARTVETDKRGIKLGESTDKIRRSRSRRISKRLTNNLPSRVTNVDESRRMRAIAKKKRETMRRTKTKKLEERRTGTVVSSRA